MFDLMYAAQGVGLAAPQVGINKRLMVYNELGDPKKWLGEMVLVNPRIVASSEKKDLETEGCLSFPGVPPDSQRLVSRHVWVKVEAMNLKGRPFKKKFVGWEVRHCPSSLPLLPCPSASLLPSSCVFLCACACTSIADFYF